MTTSDAGHADTGDRQPVPAILTPPAVEALVRPMPRLGRGIVWSAIVAEIERDHQARMRDAA
ncbi:hypothetical protein Amsp01_057310 [Amycolatopsis sp. NBRC 101858]|jgi:hypothetical protein|uniref:DUF6222 family protein n=1 Tax=Amycolatopsis TaxID=1813 RepID=UPI00249FF0D7|nr:MULTISPECIES: DUF6222 family protein [unclassified Amycolatopsis]GLY39708.1 hypothetical protein Amsp01_057310 [Amycolatopsis sp. NBRC 101858]